ncbi:hypothetical protein AB1L42_22925 [Thalassoglobus sp. JC818]|uniref:hypothetical protein n=1 Tax=Thalassoglobus sp. JC818 TaxID=3232136 RepID=UPI003459E41E
MVSLKSANCDIALIDGPNIDGVLGQILQRQPISEDRPQWDVVRECLQRILGIQVPPMFVIDGTHSNERAYKFYRFLRSAQFRLERRYPDLLLGHNSDPVDDFILGELDRVCDLAREGSRPRVVVVSHDHVYAPILQTILKFDGKVSIVGFHEELSPALLNLRSYGAELYDLEKDFRAFLKPLPRWYRGGSRRW